MSGDRDAQAEAVALRSGYSTPGEGDEFGRQVRVAGHVLDPPRFALVHADVGEPDPGEVGDEGTLRQGS